MKFALLACLILYCSISSSLGQQVGWSSYPGTEVGIKYWKYCTIAFCDAKHIQEWNCGPTSEFQGFTDITVAQSQQLMTQAYIGYYPTDNTIVVSFRGSQNLVNWVLNLEFLKTTTPFCDYCFVHNGFYQAYMSLQSQVIAATTNLMKQYPKAKVAITGTSLGAAEATICAADFIYQNINYDYFITFGSPRVGNKYFADWFENNIKIEAYRVVHYKDMVPHFFPQSFDYQHINTEVWYTSDTNNDFKICPQTEDPICSNQFNIFECKNSDHTTYFNLDREQIVRDAFRKNNVTITF